MELRMVLLVSHERIDTVSVVVHEVGFGNVRDIEEFHVMVAVDDFFDGNAIDSHIS